MAARPINELSSYRFTRIWVGRFASDEIYVADDRKINESKFICELPFVILILKIILTGSKHIAHDQRIHRKAKFHPWNKGW